MRALVACLLVLAVGVGLHAGDPTGKMQTIEFVQKLQTPNGGFLSMPPAPNIRLAPTLKATSAAVRALHYLNGKVPNPEAAKKFVASCYDAKSGGFADMPGGMTDVATTAVGIMAVRALDMPLERYADGAAKYLSDNANAFEEIRIAVAGLEQLERKSPRTDLWLAAIKKLQNADGTFGSGLGQARETGGSAVILLRLGQTLDKRDAVLNALREGQRPSGGFGKADSELDADLETSYRVMRCFMMLKERPTRVEGLRTYVAKCRNEDGGYGISPGESSTIGATYFAVIVKKWLE